MVASELSNARVRRLLDLRRRIHRVVEHIDENIDSEFSLNGLAEIACISPFHFHRVYSRVVGQSPTETIRRLRLKRATDDIRRKGITITEAALSAGYGSPQAFARAYRREFGQSPTEMLALSGRAASLKPETLPFTIVERPRMDLGVVTYEGVREFGDLVATDMQAVARLAHPSGRGDVFSVYFDDMMTPYDRNYRLVFGIDAEASRRIRVRNDVADFHVEGGLYACIEQRGRLFELRPHWHRFVNQVLPHSGWRVREAPILRWYLSDRAITPPSQRMGYLYLPVERIARN